MCQAIPSNELVSCLFNKPSLSFNKLPLKTLLSLVFSLLSSLLSLGFSLLSSLLSPFILFHFIQRIAFHTERISITQLLYPSLPNLLILRNNFGSLVIYDPT